MCKVKVFASMLVYTSFFPLNLICNMTTFRFFLIIVQPSGRGCEGICKVCKGGGGGGGSTGKIIATMMLHL